MKKIFTMAAAVFLGTSALAQTPSFPLEFNGGYIDFNDDSNFKDAYYYGGSTGFNFTENAGLRGYYWKALQDGKIKEGDQLEIYGVETKVKAPITSFFKPYLVVGGGLLKPYGDYTGKDGEIITDDKFFGSAGAGLDLSFIEFLSVTGYARAMVSEFDQLNSVGQEGSDISASWNYGGSINFRLGGKRKGKLISNGDVPVLAPRTVEAETVVVEHQDSRVSELEERLDRMEQEEIRRREIEELRKEIRQEFEGTQQEVIVEDDLDSQIAELEERVEELSKAVMMQDREQEESLRDLERSIEKAKLKRKALENAEETPETKELKKLLDENIELMESERKVKKNRKNADTVIVEGNVDRGNVTSLRKELSKKEYRQAVSEIETTEGESFFDRLFYSHTDGFIGGAVGKESFGAFTAGVRPNINIAGTKFRLLPEVSVNLAKETGVNLYANAAHGFNVGTDAVSPYAGAGVGVSGVGKTKPALNLLVGTDINSVLDGKLNAQFDTRNLLKYNQLSIGYKLF